MNDLILLTLSAKAFQHLHLDQRNATLIVTLGQLVVILNESLLRGPHVDGVGFLLFVRHLLRDFVGFFQQLLFDQLFVLSPRGRHLLTNGTLKQLLRLLDACQIAGFEVADCRLYNLVRVILLLFLLFLG